MSLDKSEEAREVLEKALTMLDELHSEDFRLVPVLLTLGMIYNEQGKSS
jgi:hypothetical protein